MKEGWIKANIGDICSLEYGKPLDIVHRVEDGLYPAYGANGIFARTNKYYYDKPSIIIGRKGTAGAITLTEEKFYPLDVTYYVVFDKNKYDLKFLYYLFLTKNIPSLAKGVKPGINRNDVYSLSINYPPTLSEQQRIVEILDTAFAKIDTVKQNAERNLINAKELFQSALDFELLPKNKWEEKKLSEICNLITDGTHSTPKYTEKGVPFLSVKNLTNGFIDFSETRFISEEEHKFLTKRCKPEQEDILYTKIGTTGIAQVIDTDKEFSIFVSVALLKVKRDIIYNYYLRHALNAPKAREQARKRTRGTANKNLVITDIKEITVPVPPISEQQQIVSKLDALSAKCKELENNYLKTINDCDELKKAILAKAFNGEL